jgi:uncharacterized protein YndB with AHSA1/START domain
MKVSGTLKVTTPTDREIAMTRVFDAPRDLVFQALTRPELLRRWLGVRGGWSMEVCEIDLKVGGAYRYVWRKEATGTEMAMGGVFREIAKPARLVQTETFDDPWHPGAAVTTTTLTEQDGRTTLTAITLYDSKQIRDDVLKSPMETGVAESYDVLDRVLASIR